MCMQRNIPKTHSLARSFSHAQFTSSPSLSLYVPLSLPAFSCTSLSCSPALTLPVALALALALALTLSDDNSISAEALEVDQPASNHPRTVRPVQVQRDTKQPCVFNLGRLSKHCRMRLSINYRILCRPGEEHTCQTDRQEIRQSGRNGKNPEEKLNRKYFNRKFVESRNSCRVSVGGVGVEGMKLTSDEIGALV